MNKTPFNLTKNHKIFGITCLTLLLLLTLFTITTPSTAYADDTEIPGELYLKKTSSVNVETNNEDIYRWDITLSLRGLDLQTTTDIVLVIDTSGSMRGDKLAATQVAANKFVDELLKDNDGGNTRIALVSFEGTATTRQGLITDAAILHTAIDNLVANGGTHIQAGIAEAQKLLEPSKANHKYIVLLGDGEPTYSYRTTAVTGVTITGETGNGNNRRADWAYDIDSDGFIMGFATTTVGSGSDFTIGDGRSNGGGADTNGVRVRYGTTNRWYLFPPDNGVPTIYQAKLAKQDDKIEIYTIAVAAGSNGNAVLKACSSGESDYYQYISNATPEELANLDDIFKKIADNIIFAARQAVVTDPIGEHFFLVPDAGGDVEASIEVSKGTIVYDATTQTITWDIGDITSDDGEITLKYTIEIDLTTTIASEEYPTNGYTYVDYIDVKDDPARKEFEDMPSVGHPIVCSITKYIYFLNDDGKPLNLQGDPAQDRDEIAIDSDWIIRVENPVPEGSNPYLFLHYDDYIVTADQTITVDEGGNAVTYVFVPGDSINFGDVSPTTVTLSSSNQHAKVYFAYQKPQVVVTFTSEDENKGTVDGAVGNELKVGGNIGDILNDPVTTAKPGYTFDSWVDDSNNPVTLPGVFPATDTTYTATWVKDPDEWVTVSFDAGDHGSFASGTVSSFEGVKGESTSDIDVSALEAALEAENAGWVFDGWDVALTSVYPGSDLTITAQWVKDPDEWVTVSFATVSSSQGTLTGTLSFEGVKGSSASAIVEPGKSPAYNYVFNSWSTAIPSVYPDADLTITASWTYVGVDPDDFVVVYYGNGASGGFAPNDYNLYSYGDQVVVLGQGSLFKNGYSFLGWSTYGNAAAQYTADNVFYIYGDTNLFAVWSLDTYTVTFEPGAHGTFAAQVTGGLHYGDATPAAPVITGETGWTFNGWSPALSTTVTGDTTYTAQWLQTALPTPTPTPTPPTVTATPTPTPPTATVTATPTPTPSDRPVGPRENPEDTSYWSIVNLILAVFGVIAVVAVMLTLLFKSRKQNKQTSAKNSENQHFKNPSLIWLIAAAIISAVSMIAFFLTEDISLTAGWIVDRWTILTVVLLALEFIAIWLCIKTAKQNRQTS
jgi:hypothetical protein